MKKKVNSMEGGEIKVSDTELEDPGLGKGCTMRVRRRESGSLKYHSTELEVEIRFECSLENMLNGSAYDFAATHLLGADFEGIYGEQYSRLIELVKPD